MKKETYIKMTQPFRDNPKLAGGLHNLNRICTMTMYILYPLFLVYLLVQRDDRFLKVLLVPAVSFVILSAGRYLINRKRPYEAFELPPVIPKDTKGKSFPSRHVFSAAVIAMTFLLMSPWTWLSVLLLCVTLLEAVVRVVSGVHYISDVTAGIVIGILAAAVYLL